MYHDLTVHRTSLPNTLNTKRSAIPESTKNILDIIKTSMQYISLLLLISVAYGSNCLRDVARVKALPGGYSQMEGIPADVVEFARQHGGEHCANLNGPLGELVGNAAQVVAGMNYRLQFRNGENDRIIKVYKRLDGGMEISECILSDC